MLTIANTISLVNNIIVTVLLSKIICKCCAGSVVSSVPIVPVHNPPVNPQQLSPTTVSPSGQQQQIQSYPIVVYSTFQQEPIPPMPHQQGHQLQDQQHPSALTKTFPRDITDPAANLIINSPPPYSTLTNGAAMEPHPKK
jgi:hypothetical protein